MVPCAEMAAARAMLSFSIVRAAVPPAICRNLRRLSSAMGETSAGEGGVEGRPKDSGPSVPDGDHLVTLRRTPGERKAPGGPAYLPDAIRVVRVLRRPVRPAAPN
ncbi:hypothetical protein Snoj_08730 [Streptomyces nojiriensis]|uniref:Secreted protein n=1 Tax=Streptomyces nojiriensis TaxID=66374 RepID=A0ABQ3SFP0_9ACTN|nr:hypothetical protein GCM10010205_36080 [Streptomyces nojiriensis]GHI66955.1 hypothetical protein Snoj_08730 [Streptomyces nojiriensis]